MSRLSLCKKEENMRQGEVPQLEEGDSVVVWWEGDLYRVVIIKILEVGKVLVRFVDWGNMATLARDMVRKAYMGVVETVVGAVKCKLLGRELLAWAEKLEQCEYMVQLKCVAMYQDDDRDHILHCSPHPRGHPRHCCSCVRGQNISLVLPSHLPVCPGHPHGQAGQGLQQPDPPPSLLPTCFLFSSVLPSSQ